MELLLPALGEEEGGGHLHELSLLCPCSALTGSVAVTASCHFSSRGCPLCLRVVASEEAEPCPLLLQST